MRNTLLILPLLLCATFTSYAQWPASGTYNVGTPGAHFATLQNFVDSVYALPTGGGPYHAKLKDTIHNVTFIKATTSQGYYVNLTFSSIGGIPANCKIATDTVRTNGGQLSFKQLSIDYNGTLPITNTPPSSSGTGNLSLDSTIVLASNAVSSVIYTNGGNDYCYTDIKNSTITGGLIGIESTGSNSTKIQNSTLKNQTNSFVKLISPYSSIYEIKNSKFYSTNFNQNSIPIKVTGGYYGNRFSVEQNTIEVNRAIAFVDLTKGKEYSNSPMHRVANNYVSIDSSSIGFAAFDIQFIPDVDSSDTLSIHNNTIKIKHSLGTPKVIKHIPNTTIYPATHFEFNNNLMVGASLWKVKENIVTSNHNRIDKNNYFPGTIDIASMHQLGFDSNSTTVNPFFLPGTFTPQNSVLNNSGIVFPNNIDVFGNNHDPVPDIGCVKFTASSNPIAGIGTTSDTTYLNCFFDDTVNLSFSSDNVSSNVSGTLYAFHNGNTLFQGNYADTGASPLQTVISIDISTLPDSGVFHIKVTDSSGVFNSGSSHVKIVQITRYHNSTTKSVNCVGNEIIITPESNAVFWSDGSLSNPRTFLPSQSIPYYINNSVEKCYRDTVQYNVNFNSPVSLLDDSVSFCFGQSASLALGNNWTQIQWSDQNTSANRSISTSGSYQVTVSNSFGCTTYDSIVVSQHANYVSLWQDSNICSYDSLTIDLTGIVDSVHWDNGSNVLSQTYLPGQSPTLQYRDSNNCWYVHTYTIQSHPKLSPYTWVDSTICNYDNIQIDYSMFSTSASWNDGNSALTRWLNDDDTLQVSYIDSLGCTYSDSFEISSFLVPTLSATQFDICEGDTAKASISNSTSQTWGNGDTGPSIEITEDAVIPVDIVGQGNCIYKDTVKVIVHEIPATNWPQDTTVCNSFLLTAGSSNGYTYSWNTGAQTSSITVDSSANYAVVISNTHCSSSDSIQVTMIPDPVAHFNEQKSVLTVTFTDQSQNATSWFWDFGDGNTSTAQNPTHTYNTYNSYTVKLKVNNACDSNIYSKKIMLVNGINELGGNSTRIYPNPFNDNITLEGFPVGTKLRLVNALGQSQRIWVSTSDKEILQLAELAEGFYFIVGTHNGDTKTYKLVKRQ